MKVRKIAQKNTEMRIFTYKIAPGIKTRTLEQLGVRFALGSFPYFPIFLRILPYFTVFRFKNGVGVRVFSTGRAPRSRFGAPGA